ncbi:exopolyphosphatase/guanosine-5'-triphosphate,3'-diphosphate pyrophosphatase [Tibeticola sediminis]|uniref:Exopolyphosphatase/guanosine-5'-triphosphate, 3'-diphosphate pyrophosphatase n=1 Tax=Tibeticola sediminis TaxID=1917811 RepID=A0A3N4VHT7_9BURK|nr:Ppx/GppA phosphatase family protein [Tibeticola sediminis]RPE72494.1 exopolyphosphatase/guanosine-5'-triphosphate,3'-diphosphate pyrophosphatase [Tibeticola sediminis]
MENGTLLAAIDLGSNSFRLEIGRFEHGLIRRVEYLKETVRQGAGLDEDRNLTAEAMQRGWACLARFSERLAGFSRRQVRAVATQTLREARNRDVFLAGAQQILGFPIDVVAGREEARLIYLGVAHLLPASEERRLVVDIGGRSTELILGVGYEPLVMESFRVGSVAWSMRHFPDGRLTERAFQHADVAAKAVLDEALAAFPRERWDTAYGASGTIGAVGDALAAAGWPAGTIDRAGLDWLQERLLRARTVERIVIEGIKEDRRAVIGGGLSVLRAVFDLLQIDRLHVAAGALRHGVLYDLIDREARATDPRVATVTRLARRFEVDAEQADRVSRTALALFGQTVSEGSTEAERERLERKLNWAAQLHEIGAQISHSNYHRHGAYILDNADAPGFSLPELHRLSQLVLGHRGKLRKLDPDLIADTVFARQLMALRLAALLCHARRDPDLEGLTLQFDDRRLRRFVLTAREGWAAAWPQSAHLLHEESLAWQKTPWQLKLVGL